MSRKTVLVTIDPHDHGPGFKRMLDNVMPGWKATADLLKKLPVLL
jgi:predicted metal-dependent hydrolase